MKKEESKATWSKRVCQYKQERELADRCTCQRKIERPSEKVKERGRKRKREKAKDNSFSARTLALAPSQTNHRRPILSETENPKRKLLLDFCNIKNFTIQSFPAFSEVLELANVLFQVIPIILLQFYSTTIGTLLVIF